MSGSTQDYASAAGPAPGGGDRTRTGGGADGPRTTPLGRMRALARAELTLLGRSPGTLFVALFVPLALPASLRTTVKDMDLAKHGLNLAEVLLPAAMGFALLFAVYTALVSTLVARREELVLKRLRTGEAGDGEILVGGAVPAVAIGLAQCLLVAVASTAVLDVELPGAPHLAVAGVLLGLVLSAVFATLTSAVTRTVESAGVTVMPFMMLSLIASGITVPLEVFPDRLRAVCELLPLSPVMALIRGAWTGELSAAETLGHLLTALAWIVLGCFAVRRWMRWEPRR
ncbi:ABC transporter permease [Streptomyces physcomitrii]|uniref:ABC transporter permease n=1 Tax=Streptomyces physcomitrii TaxID=2724184 RepID=UPI003F4CCD94